MGSQARPRADTSSPFARGRAHSSQQRQLALKAKHTPIQGTAADLMKLAMLRVDEALDAAGSAARILLQVHDELLLEVPENELEQVGALVRESMESVHPLAVPLVVDQKTGRSWLDAT